MTSPSDVLVIQKALEQSRTKEEFKKVLCLWLKVSLSLNSKQIAIGIGQTPAAVRKTQSRFAKEGVEAFFTRPRGGRKRENISFAREKQILNKFRRRAQRGSVLSVAEIQKAYELSAGKTVAQSTIYRLIARHGLRRYLPKARGSG
jgi:Homeodomain-like domain